MPWIVGEILRGPVSSDDLAPGEFFVLERAAPSNNPTIWYRTAQGARYIFHLAWLDDAPPIPQISTRDALFDVLRVAIPEFLVIQPDWRPRCLG